MAFTNIIDIIYPTGSIYFSNTSTSPATLFGGTWAQIKSALIAATGYSDNGVGTYSGSNYMTVDQMPAHIHAGTRSVTMSLSKNYEGGENFALSGQSLDFMHTFDNWTNSTGGGNPSTHTTIARMFGYVLHKCSTLRLALLKFQECVVM